MGQQTERIDIEHLKLDTSTTIGQNGLQDLNFLKKCDNKGCPKIGGPICFLNNFAYLKPNSMPSGRVKIETIRIF